ncbi:MAG: hypothetical protein IPP86_00250 [Bacteroidetes bacterium]|nr:hypothetical protein [Bacteroidota bacterium]
MINPLTKKLQKQIHRLESERDEVTKTYKARIKVISSKIHWLRDQVANNSAR